MTATMIWCGVGAYLLISTLVAFASRSEKATDMPSYFLGNRKMNGFVSALSYSATTYSAFMIIGLAGLTYAGGIGAFGFELMYFAGVSLVAVFGPKFWRAGKKFGYVTPSEMFGHRYDSKAVAIVMSLASCLFLIPYAAVQLSGIGLLLAGMSGGAIPFTVGIALATGVAILFSYIAGIRSVMWTDSLQAIVMIVASTAVVLLVVSQLGGFQGLFGALRQAHPESLTVPGNGFFSLTTFLALSIPWFFFSLSSPQLSQRLFMPSSLKSMRQMLLGFLIFGLLFTAVAVLWGLAAVVALPELASADLATPSLLSSGMVPPFLAVIVMVGVMAAAVSTIDSIMLTLSSMLARDVYGNASGRCNEKAQLAVGKVVIPVIAVMALGFAQLQLDLIAILSVASSVGLVVMVPTIIGAFYWKRGTAAGAITSTVFTGSAVIYAQFSDNSLLGWPPGIWGIFVASLVYISVSLLTSAPIHRADAFIAAARGGKGRAGSRPEVEPRPVPLG